MAAINNNNFELFTFMNEFMHDDSDDEFFVLYRNNYQIQILYFHKTISLIGPNNDI